MDTSLDISIIIDLSLSFIKLRAEEVYWSVIKSFATDIFIANSLFGMQASIFLWQVWFSYVGKDPAIKSDDFLEKFQTAFDPPPSFLENYIAIFFIMDMVAFMQGGIGQVVSVNISWYQLISVDNS